MTIDELERRLRAAAPDEPVVLPPLILPVRLDTSPFRDPAVELRLGQRRRAVPMSLLAAVLLLSAALVGALLAGALRLELFREAVPLPGLYSGRGISIDYPDEWVRFTPAAPLGDGGAQVALIVGSHEVDGCEPDSEGVVRNTVPPQPEPSDGMVDGGYQQGSIYSAEDRIYACLLERPMDANEIRLVAALGEPQIIGVGPFGDFTGPFFDPPSTQWDGSLVVDETFGFTDVIGEMPAKLVVTSPSAMAGGEEVRTWIIAPPGHTSGFFWFVQAVLRGPDMDTLRATADEVARSLTFTNLPPPLDEATMPDGLAAAVDGIDREMRNYPGRRFLACLPRTPGSRDAIITDGPRGRLLEPLAVRCTTSVEPGETRIWRATLEVAWESTRGVPAGRWAYEVTFSSDGLPGGMRVLHPNDIPLELPGDRTLIEPPSDAVALTPGDLALSIGAGAGASFYDMETTLLPPEPYLHMEAGELAVILSGPEQYDGRDFYFARKVHEFGWIGSQTRGRDVVLVPVEPLCPDGEPDVLDLMYMSPHERWRCSPGELVLGPVQAARVALDEWWGDVRSDPSWLAAEPSWRLFGEDGPEVGDPGFPVVLAPEIEKLPADEWLIVRGHFDDPASRTCSMVVPEQWNTPSPPEDVAVSRCQERFVVTGFEPTTAP